MSLTANGDLLISDYGNNVVRDVQAVPPDLVALAASGPALVRFGGPVAYQLTVTNPGTVGGATGVTVTDTIPSALSSVTVTTSQGSCTTPTNSVTCDLGALPADASATVTISGTAPFAAGTLVDTATVTTTESDPNPADNSATISATVTSGQGFISTLAGNGTAGYAGDGGPASAALLNNPSVVRTDAAGDILVADTGNNVVRKVDPFGTITTVAGNAVAGFTGDGGPAPAAELNAPVGLALDSQGDLFIADTGNNRVREVDPSGYIRTVTGDGVFAVGQEKNNVPALSTSLGNALGGVAVDTAGNLYIADNEGGAIFKVDKTGILRFIQEGSDFQRGDGGPAIFAVEGFPLGMSVDSSNGLLIATGFATEDIRKINLGTGIISTAAGSVNSSGTSNFAGPSGDGGPATSAMLAHPSDVTVDGAGDLFIADNDAGRGSNDNAIREVDTHGIISTVAGAVASGYSGDGGPATAATLNNPQSAAPLPNGAFVIADSGNNALRIVQGAPDLLNLQQHAPVKVGAGSTFSYQLQVANNGSFGPATSATVTDHLPAGVALADVTASQGSCSVTANTVTCSLGTVPPSSTVSITIKATAPSTSTAAVNTATVTQTETDPYTGDNTSSATTYVAASDVVVSQQASPGSGSDVGNPLTYTATVTNRGPTDAASVTVSDPLPAGLTLTGTSVSQGRCTHTTATVTCRLGTVASGATASVIVKVKPSTAGQKVNTVTVTSAQADPYPTNNTATTYPW